MYGRFKHVSVLRNAHPSCRVGLRGLYRVYLLIVAMQFHVDNLSSAHVYVRLRPGETWTDIPRALLEDCAQLTKANSIEGRCRMSSDRVDVHLS